MPGREYIVNRGSERAFSGGRYESLICEVRGFQPAQAAKWVVFRQYRDAPEGRDRLSTDVRRIPGEQSQARIAKAGADPFLHIHRVARVN
ncbi:hypothetical protein LMG27174_07320 [Paraburkholderia rhynchosiae]|uniref:Uncharacterized protein n=1 Tax=Paraburkholderia rhynchosiae TaxID=487049 RepID=A0A6J5CT93_9BURK|nr:hypothetical protein LMG27174_07320 [Paraburkholderia rhynchosiae]